MSTAPNRAYRWSDNDEAAFRRYCSEHNMKFVGDKVGVYQ